MFYMRLSSLALVCCSMWWSGIWSLTGAVICHADLKTEGKPNCHVR